jgi:hypothetical protein
MNSKVAKELAQIVTNQQLKDMFIKAKENIKDWKQVSIVNKGLSKGTNWNILAADFQVDKEYHILAKINMIREFGEFLDENIKPKKIKKIQVKVAHQEPNFENYD